MSDAYGELFHINEAGTTINIPTAGTFVKWVNFSAGLSGPTDLVLVDAANNQFVIGANGGGGYFATVGITMTGSNNSLKQAAVHVNGVRQQKIESNRQIAAAMDVGFFEPLGLIPMYLESITQTLGVYHVLLRRYESKLPQLWPLSRVGGTGARVGEFQHPCRGCCRSNPFKR